MDERTKRLCGALIEVLNAIEDHEAGERKSFADPAVNGLLNLDQMGELSDRGEFFLADPIGYGLRKSVRKVGELLAKDFPSDMQDIAEQAASARGNWGIRIDIIDKRWDGIKMSDGDIWIA